MIILFPESKKFWCCSSLRLWRRLRDRRTIFKHLTRSLQNDGVNTKIIIKRLGKSSKFRLHRYARFITTAFLKHDCRLAIWRIIIKTNLLLAFVFLWQCGAYMMAGGGRSLWESSPHLTIVLVTETRRFHAFSILIIVCSLIIDVPLKQLFMFHTEFPVSQSDWLFLWLLCYINPNSA